MARDLRTEANVRAFYDARGWKRARSGVSVDADLWEDLRPAASRYVTECRRRVGKQLPASGTRLLDAASGPIQYPEYLEYSQGFETRVCVDISESALTQARALLCERGEYVNASILELPFPDHHFDAAISLHTIYHVAREQQAAAVGELIRVTRPGQPIVIVYANPDRLIARLTRALRPRDHLDATELYYFAHPLAWWQQFSERCSVELSPWRSLAARDSKRLIPNNRIGRSMLDLVARAERHFPAAATRWGAYPLIVLRPHG